MQRHSLGGKRSSTRQSKAEKRASGCRSQLVQAVSTCSSPAPRQGANRAKTRFTMAASWASNNAALLALKPSPALLEAADPLVRVLQARVGYRDEASVAAAAHAVAKLACVRGTTPAQLEPFIKNAARAAMLRMGQIVTLEDPIFEANHVFLVDGKLSCHLIVGKMEYPSASDRDGDQPLISLLMQGKSDEGKKPMSMERAAALALRLAEKRFGEVLAEYTTGVTLSEASTLLQSSLQRAVFVANTPSTLMLLPREELNTLLDEAMAKSSREHDEAMTWLSKAPSFEGCGTWLVGQMIKNSVRRTFAFGEEVTREGAHSNDLLLVCAGEVVLTTTAKPTHRVMSAGATSPRSLLRELPLRHLGPLQLIPCLPVHADLQEGVHFACSARVISAHATLLLLDCRYLGGVLQRSGERAERAERAGAPTLQHQRSSLSGRSHARKSIAPPPATERKEVWPDVAASLRVDAARIARLIDEAQPEVDVHGPWKGRGRGARIYQEPLRCAGHGQSLPEPTPHTWSKKQQKKLLPLLRGSIPLPWTQTRLYHPGQPLCRLLPFAPHYLPDHHPEGTVQPWLPRAGIKS
ncbi:hypothetical protein AB1Y20_015511 [Prymnesium parvum]|uniref:Cyclic nucleotide-binding domain-containing protein n=1 Tax=Prymnesium parvum TaxID=97485 RepID=A0AB34JYL1_PRYPA